MQAHTVERVESWHSRPFSGGYRELQDLADREFSGAVVADGTWLFMLNGRVIGVFEGDIEDFEAADGTVYEAPDPSVALLFSMQERGGETQAKYYTNDTPLSEAAETLSDANFTGYVELSENVLSGDYYVVYYGGRSMSAAFVGASEELITGEEAFERADDEVGVYEVKKTPVNVTTIPEVEDEDDAGAAGAAGGAAAGSAAAAADSSSDGSTDPADVDATPDEADTDVGDAGPGTSDDSGGETADEPASGSPSEDRPSTARSRQPSTGAATEQADDAAADAADESSPSSAPGAAPGTSSGESGRSESGSNPAGSRSDSGRDEPSSSSRPQSSSDSDGSGEGDGDEEPTTGEPRTGDPDRMFDEEEQWRNATSVPTLDPEKSESTDGGAAKSRPSKSSASSSNASNASKPSGGSASSGSSGSSRSSSGGKPRSTVDKLKRAVKQRDAKLEEASERIETLQAEREDLQTERDELRERVAQLESERDDLRARIDDLEAQLDAAARDDGGSEATAGADLAPDAALSGTNLFVRYDSKGKATLDGLDADTDPAAVNENLRIEHHTQFDAADATVDGEDFEAFLEATGAYRFVSWAVRELPFEIRDAGHSSGLAELLEAIPEVDRAELDGTVAVDTEDGSKSRTFDVVLRDRMGDPLVVAELNAEREPVTGPEMEELVDDATTVSEGADGLSAAMYVTASFFEPAALETADEETGGGGFLSRSDRESFVNTGRKAGYHLCLVEDRNDAFHVTVPEL